MYITGIEKHAILLGQELAGPPTTAFEAGCDGGRWSKMLADLGWEMTCTDVNADALAVCRKRMPDARCIVAKPEDAGLAAEPDSTQLLLCIEVPPVIQADWFIPEAKPL